MAPRFSDEELQKAFDGAATIRSEDGREYRCHLAPASSKLLVTLAPHEKSDA
jgi:hypothetical protein